VDGEGVANAKTGFVGSAVLSAALVFLAVARAKTDSLRRGEYERQSSPFDPPDFTGLWNPATFMPAVRDEGQYDDLAAIPNPPSHSTPAGGSEKYIANAKFIALAPYSIAIPLVVSQFFYTRPLEIL